MLEQVKNQVTGIHVQSPLTYLDLSVFPLRYPAKRAQRYGGGSSRAA